MRISPLLARWVVMLYKGVMTTIVLAHPNDRCPRFQVFGVYDGDDDHFVFNLQEFDDREGAERVAGKMMERHGADHFERVMG